MLVFELDQVGVGADDLVGFVDGGGEELGEREPLAGHFVAVVGVDELVVVDAVGGVALHALDGGLAGVEGDDLGRVSHVIYAIGIIARQLMKGIVEDVESMVARLTSSTKACLCGLNFKLLLGSGS